MATTDSDGFTVEVSFEVNNRMSDDLREERNPNSAPANCFLHQNGVRPNRNSAKKNQRKFP